MEFALVAPFLMLLVAAVLAYGSVFATSLCLQRIAAEAVRATIGGVNDGERQSLASAKLAAIADKYPMLDSKKVKFIFDQGKGSNISRITFTYVMSDHPSDAMDKLLPLPPSPLSYSMIITDGDGAGT